MRPPLGANKSGLCRQVVFIHRFNTLKQCETCNERGDRKDNKKHKDHQQRSKRERAEMGFSVWALLGLPSNFCWRSSQKRRFRIVTPWLHAGKTGRSGARKTRSLVAQRQVVGLQVMTSENLATRGNGEYWFYSGFHFLYSFFLFEKIKSPACPILVKFSGEPCFGLIYWLMIEFYSPLYEWDL